MKLITWNCNMAFRKKAGFILTEQPDVLIIPECENKERLIWDLYTKKPSDFYWEGEIPSKGIGVFTYGDFKIKLLDGYNRDFKFVIPLQIFSDQISFTLFAIWTQKPKFNTNYIEHVWKAVNHYSHLLRGDNVILAGDFNSNTFWDKPRREINHSSLIELLQTKNISSTYHHYHKLEQGKEKHNTLFMQRKIDKGYHIDYCFASANLIRKLKSVEVGEYEKWTKYSDHKPLTVTFDI